MVLLPLVSTTQLRLQPQGKGKRVNIIILLQDFLAVGPKSYSPGNSPILTYIARGEANPPQAGGPGGLGQAGQKGGAKVEAR